MSMSPQKENTTASQITLTQNRVPKEIDKHIK